MTEGTRVLTTDDMAEMLQVSRSSIKRWAKEDRLPPAIQAGPRLLRWHAHEVHAWIAAGCPKQNEGVG